MKLHELFSRKLSKEEQEFGVNHNDVDDYDTDDENFGNPFSGRKEDEKKLNDKVLKRRRQADDENAKKAKQTEFEKAAQKEKSKMERLFTKNHGPTLEKLFVDLFKTIKDENVEETLRNIALINQKFDGRSYFTEDFIRLTLPKISKGIIRKLNNMAADVKDDIIYTSTAELKLLEYGIRNLNNNLNIGYRY